MQRVQSSARTIHSCPGAIWDVDFSLIPQTSVERLFIRFLLERHRLGLAELARTVRAVLLEGQGPIALRLKTTKAYLAGHSAREMEQLARIFTTERLHSAVSAGAIRIMNDHRRQGFRLLLLTGCPEFLIRPLAEDLGVESLIGTRLEEVNGRWTGRLIPPHPYGEAKRRLLQVWALDRGVQLGESHAYADSPADLEMLEAVGHPHVVNPNPRMRRIALARGWSLVEW